MLQDIEDETEKYFVPFHAILFQPLPIPATFITFSLFHSWVQNLPFQKILSPPP